MCAVPTIALRSEANAGGGSAHGMYVDANNSNNDLRATASSVVSGAKFAIVHNSDGTYSLYSMFRMNYVSAVVDADNNGTNPLRAGSPTIGDWEKYSIETVGGNVRLLAKVNNLYVSAVDSSQTPPYLLRAYTPGTPDRLGDWETFSIHACNAEATAVLGSLPSTNGC
jgi:hypothetical protein